VPIHVVSNSACHRKIRMMGLGNTVSTWMLCLITAGVTGGIVRTYIYLRARTSRRDARAAVPLVVLLAEAAAADIWFYNTIRGSETSEHTAKALALFFDIAALAAVRSATNGIMVSAWLPAGAGVVALGFLSLANTSPSYMFMGTVGVIAGLSLICLGSTLKAEPSVSIIDCTVHYSK